MLASIQNSQLTGFADDQSPVISHRLFRLLVTSHKSLVTMVLLLLLPMVALAVDKPEREVQAYVVKGYDYVPGPTGDTPEIGKSLCATRCNAFSSDYLNYTQAGGWRMVKTVEDEKVVVDLNNPFVDGHCLCTADRYQVVVNELSYPDINVLGEKIEH